MLHVPLLRLYCYFNVKDLYCKETDTSLCRVRHNKDTVFVTQPITHPPTHS